MVDGKVRSVTGALPEQLVEIVQRAKGLTLEEGKQLQQLLKQWIGRTDVVYNHIPTGAAAPIREQYWPVPPVYIRNQENY